MKTIIVAGGAGFIGHHLCKRLIQEGNFVIVIDNLITGNKKNIIEGCKFVSASITSKNIIDALRISPVLIDEIYHLASPASPMDYISYPWSTIEANTIGTYNLMNLAFQSKAKFLFASTSEVYGDPKIKVQPENYFGNVNTQGNRAVYDESKRMGETLIATSNRENNTCYKIARIFNTFGPNMGCNDGRVIPSFIMSIIKNKPITVYGDGSQTRSFCYVDDIVDGLIKLMKSNETGPMNLGNPDNNFSILDLAFYIMNRYGSNVTLRTNVSFPTENDPFIRKPDITLAKMLLGWAPKVKFEDGIDKTFEYFKDLHEEQHG